MNSSGPNDPLVPFTKVGALIRQLAHDVRNGLNAMDLEAALVSELVTDQEACAELQKLRRMISDAAKKLQHLASRFGTLSLHRATIPASEFVEAFRKRVEQTFHPDAQKLAWSAENARGSIEIDYEMMSEALRELFANALQFREGDEPIEVRATSSDGRLDFEISHRAASVSSDPADWGRDPLVSSRRGAYGLGLFHARRIIEAHGGQMDAKHDGARLQTRVSLPAAG